MESSALDQALTIVYRAQATVRCDGIADRMIAFLTKGLIAGALPAARTRELLDELLVKKAAIEGGTDPFVIVADLEAVLGRLESLTSGE